MATNYRVRPKNRVYGADGRTVLHNAGEVLTEASYRSLSDKERTKCVAEPEGPPVVDPTPDPDIEEDLDTAIKGFEWDRPIG